MTRAAKVRRPRVFGVVDAVAEAGDFLLPRKHLADVLDRIGTSFFDREEQLHRSFVRAAVERSFQRADGSGDR